jgi:hypothetical protein
LQFSLQAASPEIFGYTFIRGEIEDKICSVVTSRGTFSYETKPWVNTREIKFDVKRLQDGK